MAKAGSSSAKKGSRSALLQREPVYQQLNHRLKELVRKSYKEGDKFLSERQIVNEFEVSRPTANKALASLVSEGLLHFKKGVGTFVAAPTLRYNVSELMSFTHQAQNAGKTPSSKILLFDIIAAEGVDAPGHILAEKKLFQMKRLRLADGIPVIFEERYVVERHCPKLNEADLNGSLYAAFSERYQLDVHAAQQKIRAVTAPEEVLQALRLPSHSAVLCVEATAKLQNGDALWFERTYYHGEHYEFNVSIGESDETKPASARLR